jgi:hypothetical protein
MRLITILFIFLIFLIMPSAELLSCNLVNFSDAMKCAVVLLNLSFIYPSTLASSHPTAQVYTASKSPSPPQTASTAARETASSSAIETLAMPLAFAAKDSRREKMLKRVSFMLGLMNVGVSGFIIGAYPTMYYLWYAVACFSLCNTAPVEATDALARYSPKAVIFCLARWIDFRKQKRHYLLYEPPFTGLFISPLCFLAFTRISRAATISATGPTPRCSCTCGCFLTAPPSSRFVSWPPTVLW